MKIVSDNNNHNSITLTEHKNGISLQQKKNQLNTNNIIPHSKLESGISMKEYNEKYKHKTQNKNDSSFEHNSLYNNFYNNQNNSGFTNVYNMVSSGFGCSSGNCNITSNSQSTPPLNVACSSNWFRYHK